MWSGAAEIVQWWVNKFAEEQLRSDIKSLVTEAHGEADQLVGWTGQGVLFEIQVAKNEHPNADGWFDAEIVGGRAFRVGAGRTPEEAMFTSSSKARLFPNIRPGYDYDPVYSGYLWCNGPLSGQVKCENVPRGTTLELKEQVRKNYGELEAQYQARHYTESQEWLQIARTAKEKLQDSKARHDIENAERLIESSQARVRHINEELKEALEREQRAERAHLLLTAASTALSVASLATMVTHELGEAPPGLAEAKTREDVFHVLDTYEDSQIRATKELTIKLKGARTKLKAL